MPMLCRHIGNTDTQHQYSNPLLHLCRLGLNNWQLILIDVEIYDDMCICISAPCILLSTGV